MLDLRRVNLAQSIIWTLKSKSSKNLIKSLYGLLFAQRGMIVRPEVYLASAGGSISVGKRLLLGETHPLIPCRSSEFCIFENSQVIADDFRFMSGFTIHINRGARLMLGSGYANYGTEIYCFNDIQIGRNVAISHHVTIRDSDNHHLTGQRDVSLPIKIGDHVWIGTNAIVLKGVNIGDGSVIAAGAIVTRDIPPHCLAAGVPARVIRTDVEWD